MSRKNEDGSLKMMITLPDESLVNTMAQSLARMATASLQ
jgi:hypothetical protein